MDQLGRRQVGFNATSRGQWDGFAEHRRGITAALARGGTPGCSRLCVLGAGNANDLDLPHLLAVHREVHLVDIDAESLAIGAGRQGVAGHPGLLLHGGVDLTAALGILSGKTPLSGLGPADFEALATWPASRAAAALPGGFDRVASTCMLSQVLETAAHALGLRHRQLIEAQEAQRVGHLRLMARLAASGGEMLLVTEVVSSDELAELPRMPDEALPGLLADVLRTGNHFRGAHPRQLLATMNADPVVGPLVAAAAPLPPWRWRLHEQTYLVAGISFRLAPR